MALIREQIKKNEFNNLPGNDWISDKADTLLRQLIPIISRNLIPKARFSHFFNLLLRDGNSKTVYDHIHLLLLLNQLQYLTVKNILDYAIKNKRNMFFNID